MDYEAIKLTLTIVNMLVTGVVGVFVWQSKRQQATVSSIRELDAKTHNAITKIEAHVDHRFNEKCRRMNEIESKHQELAVLVSKLPNERHITRLHDRLDTLNSSINKDFQGLAQFLGELSGKIGVLIDNKEKK